MRNKSKRLGILILAMIMMLGMTMSVYGNDKKTEVENFIKSTISVGSNGNLVYTNGMTKAYTSTESTAENMSPVDIGDSVLVYYNPASIDVMYVQAVKFKENQKVGEKMGDITSGLQIEANTGAAAVMLSGFKPILELGIGVIVVLITFGMTLFSAFDICYIAFPVFRNKAEEAKQSGNSMMTKKSHNGENTLRWITDDAQYAVTQGTIDSGKSPWKLYFGKRVSSYIFLGITLFILLTGNISLITDVAIKVVSGVIDVVTGLA